MVYVWHSHEEYNIVAFLPRNCGGTLVKVDDALHLSVFAFITTYNVSFTMLIPPAVSNSFSTTRI